MTRDARLPDVARSLIGVARDQQLSFLAAAIAYYAFVSVIPLVLLGLAVSSAIAGPRLAAGLLGTVGVFLSPEAATLVESALTSTTGRGGATAVGLVVLLWSSLRVFRGLDIAFSRVYGVEGPTSLFDQIRDALSVFLAIGAAVLVTVAVGTALSLDALPFAGVFGTLFLIVALSVVFLPLYYVFPDCPVTVTGVVPGAVFAAGGWALLGTLFSVYAARATGFQLYGLIGGVLLALTWFYAGGLVLLLGAALNAVLDGHRDRQLQQGSLRDTRRSMSESEDPPVDDRDRVSTVEPESITYRDLADLRRELERFEEEIEDRTVHREQLESDLQRYVRARLRRGHARGWGPYLVLLYGTVMTLGAFYLLEGGWAVLAMIVVWLSTLGLYALMLVVGATLGVAGLSGRAIERLRSLR